MPKNCGTVDTNSRCKVDQTLSRRGRSGRETKYQTYAGPLEVHVYGSPGILWVIEYSAPIISEDTNAPTPTQDESHDGLSNIHHTTLKIQGSTQNP